MQIICTATVDNLLQRELLCEKIEQLGIVPVKARDMVYVEYNGVKTPTIEKLIRLFEDQHRHGISAIEP